MQRQRMVRFDDQGLYILRYHECKQMWRADDPHTFWSNPFNNQHPS